MGITRRLKKAKDHTALQLASLQSKYNELQADSKQVVLMVEEKNERIKELEELNTYLFKKVKSKNVIIRHLVKRNLWKRLWNII